MSEGEHKASVQHTPAEWTSSNQDQYVNADKARYNSEKVSAEHRHTDRGHLSSAGQEPGIPPHQRHPEQNITVSPDHRRGRTYNFILNTDSLFQRPGECQLPAEGEGEAGASLAVRPTAGGVF